MRRFECLLAGQAGIPGCVTWPLTTSQTHLQIQKWRLCLYTGVVDVVLIPEVPFELDALLDHVAKTLDRRGHVVICTAEGAGQVRTRRITTLQGCTQALRLVLSRRGPPQLYNVHWHCHHCRSQLAWNGAKPLLHLRRSHSLRHRWRGVLTADGLHFAPVPSLTSEDDVLWYPLHHNCIQAMDVSNVLSPSGFAMSMCSACVGSAGLRCHWARRERQPDPEGHRHLPARQYQEAHQGETSLLRRFSCSCRWLQMILWDWIDL